MIRLITKSNFNREKYIASYSIKLFHKIISVTLAQIKTFVLFPFLLLHSVTLTRNYHLHFSDEKPENWTDNEEKKKSGSHGERNRRKACTFLFVEIRETSRSRSVGPLHFGARLNYLRWYLSHARRLNANERKQTWLRASCVKSALA